MARCEDCLHFEVCEALEQGNGLMKVSPIHCGYYKTTADVAPKSEVEKLNKELDELAEEHSDLIVEKDQLFDIAEKQKLEIWRLQGEVEQLRHRHELAVAEREANVRGFTEELQKAKTDVAREIFADIEKILDRNYYDHPFEYYASYMSVSIRQLKKKYTEASNEV